MSEIQEIIGLAQSTISFDLKKLEESGIVTYNKSGLWVKYAINKNLEANLWNIIKLLINELKSNTKIKKDLKKAEKILRLSTH